MAIALLAVGGFVSYTGIKAGDALCIVAGGIMVGCAFVYPALT